MGNNSRRSETEMDISFHVPDDQFICGLCSDSWLNNQPRWLPCENNHIFCSNCLLEFANSNNIKSGDNFFCPVCNEKHTWGEDGIDAFGAVNNEQSMSRCPQSESDESTGQESSKSDNVKVLPRSFSLRSSQRSQQSFKERILGALEKLRQEKENDYKELEVESKNLHLLINSKQQSLQNIISKFYSHKEYRLRHLLEEVSDGEQEPEDEDKVIDTRRGLINRMKTVFRSTIKFSKPNLIDNFNTGEVFLINNDEDDANDENLFQSTSEILSITSSRQAFYVLTEQNVKESVVYKIFMLTSTGSKFVLLKSWTSDEKFHYKMVANRDLYLLEVGSSAGLMRLRSKGRDDSSDVEFERFKITVHKPSPLLRKIYSKTYSTNLACSDTTLVLVNNNGVLEKYSTEPLEKIRSMKLPAKNAIADIRCSNLYIVVLFQGGSVCFTYTNSLKTNFEYLRKLNLSSIFDVEGFIIPPLRDGNFILSDKSNVYNVNPTKSTVEYCSFTRVFKDVIKFDYKLTENHIFLFTITDSNAVIVNRFKL